MKTAHNIRERLANGEVLHGPACMTGSATVAEVLAFSGFDWVMLDAEHGPHGVEMVLEDLIRAVNVAGLPAAVRVPDATGAGVGKALDFGAEIIIVPQVGTADQARACVERGNYAPLGERGVCRGTRAGDRGGLWGKYRATANAETLMLMLIETEEGVENAAEIAAVEGVDGLLLGPSDYAMSRGIDPDDFIEPSTPGPAHPAIAEAWAKVVSACAESDGLLASYAYNPTWYRFCLEQGSSLILYGTDVALLSEALQGLNAELAGLELEKVGAASGNG